ncbi:MAG: hypothetical protein WAM81_04235, partial [Acidimicrobiia bacterium]
MSLPDLHEGTVVASEEALWRIRLRLAWRGFRKGWSSFVSNRIGIVGLSIIVLYGLMALAHPILMHTVWDPKIYDPVVGYDAPVVQKVIVPDAEVTDPETQIDLFSARLINPLLKVGETMEISQQPAPPSENHLLGTDPLGRDVLSQLMYSTRAAFILGIVAALV